MHPRLAQTLSSSTLLAAALLAGCSTYADPERIPALSLPDQSRAAVVRESDNTFVQSVDGHIPDRRLLLSGAIVNYHQYLVSPGTHTLELVVSCQGAASNSAYLTVDLRPKATYTLKSNAAFSLGGFMATVGNCNPAILDDATHQPLTPTTRPTTAAKSTK